MQTIDVFSRIAEIPRDEWDRLITKNVFATHGWLQTVERTFIGDIRPFYVLVRENGRTVGSTVCYIFSKTQTVSDLDDYLFGRIKPLALRLGVSFMPAMVCGTLWGYGDHLAVEPEATPEHKQTVMNKLLDMVEGEAKSNGLPINLIEVPEGDLELATVLQKHGYCHSRHVPMTLLDICWSSFKEYEKYLDRISRHARKNVRTQINKNRKSGTTVSVLENVNENAERLHELLTMNYRKYWNLPFCFNKDFFSELKRNLGQNAILHISRKADIVTGVSVELRYNRVSHVPLVGVDHEKCGNDMTYFVLTYYTPIAEAISGGVTRLYLGPGHYLMKMRLGCKTMDLFNWHKSHRPIAHQTARLWFAILSNWNRYKLPRQATTRFPQVMGALKNKSTV
ncbi:MAG: GNAT family N-acetyltransferase [Syntrophaceae bacterium]|nr:GNAT family N-acetyltransferase [Syntrophaceae bacterium]